MIYMGLHHTVPITRHTFKFLGAKSRGLSLQMDLNFLFRAPLSRVGRLRVLTNELFTPQVPICSSKLGGMLSDSLPKTASTTQDGLAAHRS